jgi:hypothetical protein
MQARVASSVAALHIACAIDAIMVQRMGARQRDDGLFFMKLGTF